MYRVSVVILLVSVLLTSGCASQNAQQQAEVAQQNTQRGAPSDPLEPINRAMWDFNWHVLDAYFWRPLTVTYVTILPQFARDGLLSAARNVQEPANVLNNLLQGKFEASADSLARFALNSTVGLFGTIDVADSMGIPWQEEEFGETLGVYGVGTGPFIMLPILGPNDPRSFAGQFVDGYVYPMPILSFYFAAGRYVIRALEARARLIDQEQQINEAIDDYAFVKNAYIENLLFRVTDGKSAEKAINNDELEDFAEFESMLNDIDTDKKDNK